MSQFHSIFNLTKRQALHPVSLDIGSQLVEIAGSERVMTALAYLLASSNGFSGGDIKTAGPRVWSGAWAGDSIAIVGDYEEGRFEWVNDYEASFEDISTAVASELGDYFTRAKP